MNYLFQYPELKLCFENDPGFWKYTLMDKCTSCFTFCSFYPVWILHWASNDDSWLKWCFILITTVKKKLHPNVDLLLFYASCWFRVTLWVDPHSLRLSKGAVVSVVGGRPWVKWVWGLSPDVWEHRSLGVNVPNHLVVFCCSALLVIC